MKVRTRTTATIDHNDIEVELSFVPFDEPTVVEPSPTTLVVGYLVHDDDCGDPMKENDAEGTLYTLGEGVITDDKSAPSYLGLNSFGGSRDDPEYDLEHEGIDKRVKEYIHNKIKESSELTAWMVSRVMENDGDYEFSFQRIVDWLQGYRHASQDFDSDQDTKVFQALNDYDTLATRAWHELYAEGKIGAYLAVPVRYMDNCHGFGTTRIHTTSLDNANAVWVPDTLAIENIRFGALPDDAEIILNGEFSVIDGEVVANNGAWKTTHSTSHADLMRAAEKYAAGTLSVYERWCNGDCWGVVVETFILGAGGYAQHEEDACWGYISSEYAEEELASQIEYKMKETV